MYRRLHSARIIYMTMVFTASKNRGFAAWLLGLFLLHCISFSLLPAQSTATDLLHLRTSDLIDMDHADFTQPFMQHRHRRSSSLCSKDCSVETKKPLCGSDKNTYRNKCHLHQANLCSGTNGGEDGKPLAFLHWGKCLDDYIDRCEEERWLALATKNESGIPMFVPVCREDGSYADVQCHYKTGYCWCVNHEGVPIPDTSVKYNRPNCAKKTKKRNRRERGQHKNNNDRNGGRKWQKKGKKSWKTKEVQGGSRMKDVNDHDKKDDKKRACTQMDRTEFNSDMLEVINRGFRKMQKRRRRNNKKNKKGGKRRTNHDNKRETAKVIGNQNQEAVDWMFHRLDRDKDGLMRKEEFRRFRLKIVKEVPRNEMCSRNMWHYCDSDGSKRITTEEWNSCLGMTETMTLFQSLSSESDKGRRPSSSSSGGQAREFQRHEEKGEEEWDEVTTPGEGCRTEHARASAKSQGKLDVKSYIPACTEEGTFEAVQCYESSGYCWCVEEKSGRPISGTSTKNGRPDCQLSGGEQSQREKEEMEASWFRCPDDKRATFRRDTMRYLKREMDRAGQEGTQSAADWKFQQLDKDESGGVSRRELRPFRQALLNEKSTRFCAKRMQVNCDSNGDKDITLEEWHVCIGIQKAHPQAQRFRNMAQTEVGTTGSRVRQGPNPLKQWLNED